MTLPRTYNRQGRKPGDAPLADTGCAYAPACIGCEWRRCVWELSKDERHIFSLAYRTLETFRAPPDEVTV